MKPELVSILMPVFNGERYIAPAIESVLRQTYPDWELIVVNDGSTDQTASIVSRYADQRIKLIHQANRGEAAARNTALDHARGEFIASLDADDLYQPNHLEGTIKALQNQRNLDAVYTDGYNVDRGDVFLTPLSTYRRGPFVGSIFAEVARASDVFGPPGCVVLRSDLVFDHHLRFDTDIVIGADWDFLIRYSALAQFGYVDQATYLYRIHPGNVTSRTGASARRASLAICRTKAIKMEQFATCAWQTRHAVFFDLLIELLADLPARQAAIAGWPEFRQLPATSQAQLLRLMASGSIMRRGEAAQIRDWLQQARILDPADRRSLVLAVLYTVIPRLSRILLNAKRKLRPGKAHPSPFDQSSDETRQKRSGDSSPG